MNKLQEIISRYRQRQADKRYRKAKHQALQDIHLSEYSGQFWLHYRQIPVACLSSYSEKDRLSILNLSRDNYTQMLINQNNNSL